MCSEVRRAGHPAKMTASDVHLGLISVIHLLTCTGVVDAAVPSSPQLSID